ncbi:MAG TPA: YbhB/YbcL family Raf kinase inhibitor-like protein, partial [Gammaproteobacteria bacterium]|nr:YbhB/YbcL family Raf kinase inhibitor-like protein [Gammaproteobacteria bacterium]
MNKRQTAGFLIMGLAFSTAALADFKLESADIAEGKKLQETQVYSGFGCHGMNISPQLSWSGEPRATKSFAVTVYDPDAPTGSGWWHWLVYNIPAGVHELARGSGNPELNKATDGRVQGKTDFGSYGYGGACPPEGSQPHHYQFKVFALDVAQLDLPENASAAMIGFNLNAHAIDHAEIEALYRR